MTPETRRLVHKTSLIDAAIAVVLSPIPLLDEVIFVPVLGVLGGKIAKRHGLTRAQTPWRPMLATAVTGLAARAALNSTVAAVPFVSAAVGGATAAVLTETVGDAFDVMCRDPAHARALPLREALDRLRGALALRFPRTATRLGVGLK